jgi:beta-lactamase class A
MKYWGLGLSAIALAGLTAMPASAGKLTAWKFDAQGDRLNFTTNDDVSPNIRLIGNPTRLIVDLPGTRLGRKKVTTALSGSFKSLRVGQFNASTARLVLELDNGYSVDPAEVKVVAASKRSWSVDLPRPSRDSRGGGLLDNQNGVAIAVPKVPPHIFRTGSIGGGVVQMGRELTWLQQRIAKVRGSFAVVNPSVFLLDLQTGDYADVGGGKAFPAASVIKLPILIAFLQDLDAGKVSLTEKLTMRPELIASGSGYMQDLPAWSTFSANYTLTKMIETSDNTATNMIMKRVGGAAVLNKRFQSWGLRDTRIRNWLPDLSGTNTVSAQDLAMILARVERGNILSASSRRKAIEILKLCRTRSLLPPGLGPGAVIAHKTGDIGFAIGDAGIIYMPNGREYIAAVMLKRPYDDPRGRDYIQTVSSIAYTYFSRR